MKIAPPAVLAALALSTPAHADAGADAKTYLERIAALDDAGPELNAVIIALDPEKAAAEASAAEKAGLPLAGRTVLVKDNVETREWPTTAGSLALAGNKTGRDAPLIARLRKAGGVVLGKTNLSEWANIRSSNSTSGWSAVGGAKRGCLMKRFQRPAQPVRSRRPRITPKGRGSCQGMPSARHHAATARSRAKVQPLPVSWCDQSAATPCSAWIAQRISSTSPVKTINGWPSVASAWRSSISDSRTRAYCRPAASG